MNTISIMNVKGGVGKTITAVNLAQILAGEHRKRVLLIDADPQGDATEMLYPGGSDEPGLYSILSMGGNGDDEIVETRYRDLDIIGASSDLFYVSMDLANRSIEVLSEFLQHIGAQSKYDYVVIDCPPSFTATSIAAICSSNHVVIPVKLDAFGIRGCQFLIDQIACMYEYNTDVKVAGILITMWRNTEVCKQSLEMLQQIQLSDIRIFDTRIRRTDKADESTFFGQALGEYSRYSSAGRDYRDFVQELLQIVEGHSDGI